jgi:tetratricopeptide (TPR) repeat protein
MARQEDAAMNDGHDDSYDSIFDRVFQRIAEREAGISRDQSAAGSLLDELMAQTVPARRLLLVTNSPRFHNLFLCELLIDRAREAAFQDATESFDLARLALTIAESLGSESCASEEVREGLWCRASAQLANALRIAGRHAEAERAFRPIEELLREDGRIALHDLARVLDLRASLHRDLRQFDLAAHQLDRVIVIYQQLGTWKLLGRALMQRSAICGETGDLETEMKLLRRALDLIDPNEEPRSFLVARHNLIVALSQSGRPREAFALLFHTRPLYFKMGDRLSLLRLRLLEGSVAMELGRLEQAEVAFREARDAYVQLSLDWDAALASLELTGVYVRQGRTDDVLHLAEEMLAEFGARNIHREALRALSYLSSAARQEDVGIALVQEISEFMKQLRMDPSLRFAPRASLPC